MNNFTWAPRHESSRQSGANDTTNVVIGMNQLRLSSQSHVTAIDHTFEQGSASPTITLDHLATTGALVPLQSTLPSSPTNQERPGTVTPRIPKTRHELQDEELPDDKLNAASFQRAFSDTKALVQELELALSSSPLHLETASIMHELHAQATTLAQFQTAPTRKIGIVGDAGVGKSSLLNSLLDYDGFVRTSSNGGACTWVPTEFHFHGLPTFSIEVDLFDVKELVDQLFQLLQFYRHFHLNQSEIDDNAERSYNEKRAQLAADTFNSMFGNRTPAQQFLLEQPESLIKREFMSLIQELRPHSSNMSKFDLPQEACADELRLLSTATSDSNARCAWPYIRRIKVYSSAHILSKGLVLVDLPGLRDLNSTRSHITERYLRQCHDVFAVCDISRATTDQSVQDILNMAMRLPEANFGIICTKSDAIVNSEARHDWRGAKGQQVKQMMDRIDADKKSLHDLKYKVNQWGQDDDDEDANTIREILRQKRQVEKQLKVHKFELDAFLIRSRNELVSAKLRDTYTETMLDGELQVFCVSNHIYKEKRNLPKDEALRYLELSGILKLRKYCISVVSESQYRSVSRFMRDEVPAVVDRVDVWLQSGSDTIDAERKLAVIQTLDNMERVLSSAFLRRGSPLNLMSREIYQHFLAHIYDRRSVAAWSAGAAAAGRSWGTWAWNTYAAFCRRYGNYSTPAVGFHDWNQEALQSMVDQLATPWVALEEHMRIQQDVISAFIGSQAESASESLEVALENNLHTLAPLRQAILNEQRLLTHNLDSAFAKKLHVDSFSGLRTSFFGVAMESTYMACNLESGNGMYARRKAIMNGKLSQNSLFLNLLSDMKDGFTTLADSLQSNVTAAVDSYLTAVHSTLDMVRNENAALESQRDLEFHSRVRNAVEKAKRELQTIRDQIED
ncbi:hypothetical protein NLG97_g2818 [Lecanicillium saksenae]|uniref:Uncharacterized protein n=1 Tax=Lecanicillium saksenae TaxID=468837 RepID=A0ACC1R2H8_9HYPO|nr:hypothetical protein NLG97_g2818 [Lecanicillium saksenae]